MQTGEPSAEKLRGMPDFENLDTDPDLAKVFNDAMTATSGMTNEIALSGYDFSKFKLIVPKPLRRWLSHHCMRCSRFDKAGRFRKFLTARR